VKGEDKLPGGEFVVARNVELVAKSLADYAGGTTSLFDRIFSKESFCRTFRETLIMGKTLSETDVDVLLLFSSRDKGLLSYDGKVVKFNRTTTNDKLGITEEDAAIASLKELVEDIRRQVIPLATRVDVLTASAKEALARNNRVSALAALKSKKITEASLEKRYATLSQLEQVASKVEEAADHIQLVKVLQGSAEVLKSLNVKVGGAEKVGEVMANLREQMDEVDEVGHIMTTAAMESTVVDEAEIDLELEEMASQEKSKAEAAEMAEKAEKERQEAASVAARLEQIPAVPPQTASEKNVEGAGQKESVTEDTATKSAREGVRKVSLVGGEHQEAPVAA
jgi:charged multivesicular body protein 7